MKLLIVSSAPLIPFGNNWKAYSPYVEELKIWERYSDEILFCCPIWETDRGLLVKQLDFKTKYPIALQEFAGKSFSKMIKSLNAILVNSVRIFKAMQSADHIHLRCPGNIGLLGCIIQILFPKKPKTAKYAGNWDPKAQQPFSYKIQKWILSNTFLTKNMQVLVYGEWPNQSKNIKPFFTASYSENEKEVVSPRNFSSQITFLFVGTLSEGKQPLYAMQLVEKLIVDGFDIKLEMFGDGIERKKIEAYIAKNDLRDNIILMGNKTKEELKGAYKKSHFLLLPSKSEGWPKVVAEAMFWGCVPIATPISCVSNMLDNENRGLLLEMNLESDVKKIENLISEQKEFQIKSDLAKKWSRNYTLDRFETEIQKLLS